jgi:hypothetical protein
MAFITGKGIKDVWDMKAKPKQTEVTDHAQYPAADDAV